MIAYQNKRTLVRLSPVRKRNVRRHRLRSAHGPLRRLPVAVRELRPLLQQRRLLARHRRQRRHQPGVLQVRLRLRCCAALVRDCESCS